MYCTWGAHNQYSISNKKQQQQEEEEEAAARSQQEPMHTQRFRMSAGLCGRQDFHHILFLWFSV